MTEQATKNNGKESTFIASMNIKRLLNDVKTIYKSPLHDNGIFYSHDQNDILKGYALIIGRKILYMILVVTYLNFIIQLIILSNHRR